MDADGGGVRMRTSEDPELMLSGNLSQDGKRVDPELMLSGNLSQKAYRFAIGQCPKTGPYECRDLGIIPI